MPKKYLLVTEVARLLGVTPLTIRNWDSRGKLIAYRNPVNNYRMYKVEDVEALMRAIERSKERPRRYKIDISGRPAKGSKNAKVTIVEWSDFQCPFCKRVTPTLDQIHETYGDQVRIVFRHLPLSIHSKAPAAHAAAEAAHKQGKFWEMHDKIFENQRELSADKFAEYAQELGLDVDQYKKDVVSAEVKKRLDGDSSAAATLGVTGTPAFFVNGRYLSGAQPFTSFKKLIDEELDKG